MAEWSEVVATTLSQFTKGAVDLTIREHPVFASLQQKGQFFFGQSGLDMTWQVKIAEPEVEAYTGGNVTYSPVDKHRRATLGWVGYIAKDTMNEKETLQNRGPEALVKRYSEVFPDLKNAFRRRMATEMYNDGVTYPTRLSGIETFCAASVTPAAGDLIAWPSSTYGGYSCAPGAVSGNWSQELTTHPNAASTYDWPDGIGDPDYEFWSPILANFSSTAWGTGSTTWVDNCERVIRRMNMWLSRGTGKDRRPDLVLMTLPMYYDVLNRASTLRKIDVPAKRMVELGFEGVMLDGVELSWEYGVPTNTAYFFNFDQMELRCMYDQLFISKGPEWDMHELAWLFLLIGYGQFKFISPSFFGKAYPYA